MVISVDFAALVALGTVASGFFWRLLAKLDKKLDEIKGSMVTREDFNGHFHLPEGTLAVRRGCQWGCDVHKETEGSLGAASGGQHKET